MSDPEDGRKRLKTSSQPDDAATATTSPLQYLPPVLVLRIASLLEVRDIVSLRMCDKHLNNISKDRHFWRGLLRDPHPPLPRALRSCLDDLLHPRFEEAALCSLMAEDRWLRWRGDRLTLLVDPNFRSHLVRFLDDRWIVSVPTEGFPVIWDARKNPPKLYRLHGSTPHESMPHESMSHIFQGKTIHAEAAVDPLQGDIIIALRKSGQHHTLQILQVHLADLRTDYLPFTAYPLIENSGIKVIGLEPSRNSAITGVGTGVQINDWVSGRVVQVTNPLVQETFETVLGARLVGDYTLLFRCKHIELLSIPPLQQIGPTFCRLRLECRGELFLGASLSEVQSNPKSPNDSSVVYVLARKPNTGFFYFRVTIYNPHHVPSGPRARMDVDLLGVYDLSQPWTVLGDEVGPRQSSGAWLGPEGKRGLWMECASGGSVTYVVAVSFDLNSKDAVTVKSGDDLQELYKSAPNIEPICDVFHTDVYGIAECDFSEATGKVVLGTMRGQNILL